MTTSKARADFRMQLLGLAILAAAAWLVYWLLGRLFPVRVAGQRRLAGARFHGVVRWVSDWFA